MGRKEQRHKAKVLKRRLSQDQFSKLMDDANKKIVKEETDNRIAAFKKLFSECLDESFKKNGISTSKSKMIFDDIELIMLRKVEEKRGE